MWQIVIPMSGYGERFRQAGYTVPKPLIPVLGKPIVAHILDMYPGEKNVFLICNKLHIDDPIYKMEEILTQYCAHSTIIVIPPHKLGPVYAVSQSFHYLNSDDPVIVNYCDFCCIWDWDGFKKYVSETHCDGAVMCYKGFHPHMLNSTNYAYVQTDRDNIIAIQEKKPYTSTPMNEYASSGAYYFSSAALMQSVFEETLGRTDLALNGEYYVSLAYRPMIEKGMDIRVYPIAYFMQWGTPEDLEEFLGYTQIKKSCSHIFDPQISGTLIMPMAGEGSRFKTAGYTEPKPLIQVDGDQPLFLRSLSDLPRHEQTILIYRADILNYDISKDFLQRYPSPVTTIGISHATEGQAVTCLSALDIIDEEKPLTISACDCGYIWNYENFYQLFSNDSFDFIVWAIRNYPQAKRNPEMYGWLDVDSTGTINYVSVKSGLSDPRIQPVVTGTFTFKRAKFFIDATKRMMARNGRINGEFYVDECCNDAITLGLRGTIFEVDAWLCWGTPNELRTYQYWCDAFNQWFPVTDNNDSTIR
jgi:NDP-sugar pyrophosphorylase family protein